MTANDTSEKPTEAAVSEFESFLTTATLSFDRKGLETLRRLSSRMEHDGLRHDLNVAEGGAVLSWIAEDGTLNSLTLVEAKLTDYLFSSGPQACTVIRDELSRKELSGDG